jgi:hypothetical protein
VITLPMWLQFLQLKLVWTLCTHFVRANSMASDEHSPGGEYCGSRTGGHSLKPVSITVSGCDDLTDGNDVPEMAVIFGNLNDFSKFRVFVLTARLRRGTIQLTF